MSKSKKHTAKDIIIIAFFAVFCIALTTVAISVVFFNHRYQINATITIAMIAFFWA